jgi:hypothetical protein
VKGVYEASRLVRRRVKQEALAVVYALSPEVQTQVFAVRAIRVIVWYRPHYMYGYVT